ncbi:uncharacterized protein K02A2.6-like [Amborella trichopoda]|uniref:uncharacterized protein K02A2.6-like n=1 Tax=Amborella trichopoda TaxID=13333 RepID=UPI0005D3AEBF|nr:uncharacterized protein K02A2.6-like [Amborella trichopoda]|eukprot:XP_011624542.1 uncharacterized protein K02A2.6-like [Amborella trichopoda]
MNYLSKWAEAIPLKSVPRIAVANFVQRDIIYRFGVPDRITSDNGPQFRSHYIDCLVNQFCFEWKYSAMYHPRANGWTEAFNKTLYSVLRKSVCNIKKNWHEKLPEALWADRTTTWSATDSTPYSLVYESEAVLPLEIQLPSLCIAVYLNMTEHEQVKLRY